MLVDELGDRRQREPCVVAQEDGAAVVELGVPSLGAALGGPVVLPGGDLPEVSKRALQFDPARSRWALGHAGIVIPYRPRPAAAGPLGAYLCSPTVAEKRKQTEAQRRASEANLRKGNPNAFKGRGPAPEPEPPPADPPAPAPPAEPVTHRARRPAAKAPAKAKAKRKAPAKTPPAEPAPAPAKRGSAGGFFGGLLDGLRS